MSDNIDIPVEASGDDGVNRLTSAIDRLIESMTRLGENSAVERLSQQMEMMQATMVTGFVNMAATSEKILQGMTASQVRAIDDGGEKAAAAVESAGLKIKAADARTWEQIQRGSAANVTAAFAQLAENIPIDAVLARFGELATGTALALDGNLASLKQYQGEMVAETERGADKQLAVDRAFAQAQEQVANQRFAARVMDFERESQVETQWLAMLEASTEKKLELESVFARAQEAAEQARFAARVMDFERETQIEAQWVAMEEAAIEKKLELESLFERTQAQIAQQRFAARVMDFERESQIETQWVAMQEAANEKKLELESAFDRAQAAAEAKRAASAAEQLERQRVLNTNYQTASPSSQVHTATQAQVYAQMGGDPVARYGSSAADANALAAAEARLALSATTAGAAHLELDGALRQAESVFKGAAHEAGLYGLAHGQLIALLAGGALAAGLHHIAETGSEVEFQLASLNALSGQMQPIDINKFIGITSGSMTSLKDAAEGVHALAQAGMDQAQAYAVLPDIMRLASLGEMSVGQAAEMAVESMHAFGKSGADLGEIGDILVAVGSKSNVSVHKLAEDMKSAAVTGEMFNLNMREITATVGALAERGLTIQPLSSALMKLYEPSAKTAKAMQDLKLSTKDDNGELKNYTKFMTELADKVNQFKVPADIFKQLGMSSRDSKAVEVMTQDLDGYMHLLHEADEAHGKMFDAMTVKEDTAEGAWKRLGSTVEGSFTRAFVEASPVIRAVEEDLMHLAGSDGAANSLAALATGVARLTRTFVENAGTLATIAGAYMALRVISSVVTWTNDLVIATRAQIAAAAEATVAVRAESAQLELFAVAENTAAAGGARLTVTMEEVAVGARLVTSAFGWISLVVLGVVSAIDLLGGAMSKNDQEHLKQQNSYDTTVDAVQREIDRLKGLEDQLRKTGETGTAAAAQVALAFAQDEEANAKLALDKAKLARPVVSATSGMGVVAGLAPTSSADVQGQQAAVTLAQKNFDEAHARVVQAMNLTAELETRQSNVETMTQVSTLRKNIEKLPDEVKPNVDTAAARAAADYANEGVRALKGQEVTEANVLEMAKAYAEVEKDITATKLDVAKAGPTDKDGARVRIEQLQEQLRLAKELRDSALADAKSENKRGELGDLQLINKELAIKLAYDKIAAADARAELAAAGPLKPGQQEKYNSKIKSADAQKGLDETAAERARADLLDKMDTLELAARAKTLADKGQIEDAYNLTYQAKNANLLANLASDIADADNTQYRERLTRYQAYLDEQRRLGANEARFKEGERAFGNADASLSTQLDRIKSQSGVGTGLGSVVDNTFASQDAYATMIPQLQAAQAKVAASSSSLFGGDDSKLKASQSELKAIQDRMASMRNGFVDLGNTISKALTDAFGKGGAALGGMITTATAYDAKMKDIQATLDASGHTEADKQQAASDTASAQVKAYGDMSGAAKGFFDVNSNGYRVLQGAEKAFRIIELAMAAENFAKKVMFKSSEVAVNVAGNATNVASSTAATAADAANAGTSASAWGITAVARSIASLPFPLNLAAGAATMAAIVALGVKMTGGSFGGSSSMQESQTSQGTGTVLGDPHAKSDSIAKSLTAIQGNTYDGLTVSQGMLTALQSIETNITSFAGQLMQNTDIANPDINLSTDNGLAKTATTTSLVAGVSLVLSPLAGAVTYLATKIPVIGNIVGKLGTALFGGKETLDNSGFTMDASTLGKVASQGVNAKSYADITTSGGLFRSDSHDTKTTDVGTEADQAIAKVITSIGDTVKISAGILGLSGDAFNAKLNSFVIDIGKISLKDMSTADQQAAIQAAFSKLGDQMASFAVSSITQYAKAGEGALQTLTRVANDYQTIDAVLGSFSITFGQIGVDSIGARESLIDLAGGLDKFTSEAADFSKNFLTKQQQLAPVQAAVTTQLESMGLAWIKTRTDFANEITSLSGKLNDPAAQQTYASLMSIEAAFAQVTPAIDDTTKSLQDIADEAKDLQTQLNQLVLTQQQQAVLARAQLDPTNQALYDQLQQAKVVASASSALASAYDTESQSLQSAIDRLHTFSQSLRTFINTLQLGTMSPLNPADKYASATSQFNTTLAAAQGGDVTAQGNLQSAAQAFLQASKDANASNSVYQADYQRVLSVSDQMATWADSQVTSGQASLSALHDEVSQLTSINTGVLSVVDAINALRVAMSHGADQSANTTAVTDAFQELLGRAPNAGELSADNAQLAAGTSLATIIDGIKHSVEYLNLVSSQPVTQSTTPSTQYDTIAPNQATTGARHVRQSTTATPVPVTTTATDPYVNIANQNAQMIAQLAQVNTQLAGLRDDSSDQADKLTEATMAAGADTADQVATAIKTTARATAWSQSNVVELR